VYPPRVSEATERQRRRVEERFTRTAEQFAAFSLATRHREARLLLNLLLEGFPDAARARALDVASGPGTFALALAPQVAEVRGLDLTPALVELARRAAADAGLANITFETGDAERLPFPDAAFDLATCGYSLHHMTRPDRALTEMARVVRSGGRIGIADLIVPAGADAELTNRIERLRDASHARTLPSEELLGLAAGAGLRVVASELDERRRDFDDWLRIAGWGPADEAYIHTRRLLETTLEDDRAGFRPARTADGHLAFSQISLFLITEKP
jgi:ubiquinone/menaquinone biosynthesis C-methylase UbiE